MLARRVTLFAGKNIIKRHGCNVIPTDEYTTMKNAEIRELQLQVKSLEQELCKTRSLLHDITKDKPELIAKVKDELIKHLQHRNEEHDELIAKLETKLQNVSKTFEKTSQAINTIQTDKDLAEAEMLKLQKLIDELRLTERDDKFLDPEVTQRVARMT